MVNLKNFLNKFVWIKIIVNHHLVNPEKEKDNEDITEDNLSKGQDEIIKYLEKKQKEEEKKVILVGCLGIYIYRKFMKKEWGSMKKLRNEEWEMSIHTSKVED